MLIKTIKKLVIKTNNLLSSSVHKGTYAANMLRGLGLRPVRPHQATLFTADGYLKLCRQRQPHPEPEPESEEAHSFTVSSLAQVSRILPVGLHFMVVTDSWWRRETSAPGSVASVQRIRH